MQFDYDVPLIRSDAAGEGAAEHDKHAAVVEEHIATRIGRSIVKQPGNGSTLRGFSATTFSGPTFNCPAMAEACRLAAVNGINRLTGY